MSFTGKDRVREHTPRHINKKIMEQAVQRIKEYSRKSEADLSARIDRLDREWDIERILELNASALMALGILRGFKRRLWLLLPGVVAFFLIQHAVQGWCPPLSIFRRLGVRTRREIEFEKYALKQLRGDFKKARNGRINIGSVLRAAEI